MTGCKRKKRIAEKDQGGVGEVEKIKQQGWRNATSNYGTSFVNTPPPSPLRCEPPIIFKLSHQLIDWLKLAFLLVQLLLDEDKAFLRLL